MEDLSKSLPLLALETTDARASVALYGGEGLLEKTIDSAQRHEETVMPAVAALLAEAGVEPKALRALAVDVGPGSFTGVRIGVCHANAMGDALDIPVVSVNALEALAYPHLHQGKAVCALIDARNGNGYGAVYAEDGGEIVPPCPCVVEDFLGEIPAEAICVGSGYPEGREHINALPQAKDIAALGAEKLRETPHGEAARPLYLRQSQAERNRKKA